MEIAQEQSSRTTNERKHKKKTIKINLIHRLFSLFITSFIIKNRREKIAKTLLCQKNCNTCSYCQNLSLQKASTH